MQHKFAKNKALEQKLIGPMEESHTKEQSPQAVLWEVLWARRSKMAAKWARTHVWATWWFFLEEDKVCGCKNKWRGLTWGPRGRGCAQGVGVPSTLVGMWLLPLLCFHCQIFSNILEKIIFKFQGIWRTFIFGVFLYCTDNSQNKQKLLFFLYLI